MSQPLTAQRLREVLSYHPETGRFTWLRRLSARTAPGAIAGCTANGYVEIRIDGRLYRAHRLAWLYQTGDWPADKVDHKNRVRSDNRWVNLRAATHAQNMQNQADLRRNNRSGLRAMTRLPSGAFRVQIRQRGWRRHLGCFPSADEASEFRSLALSMLQTHCPENAGSELANSDQRALPTLAELARFKIGAAKCHS